MLTHTAASLAPDTLGQTVVGYFETHDERLWLNAYADVNGRAGVFQKADDGATDNPADALRWALTTPELNSGQSVPSLVVLFGHLANFLRVTPVVDFKAMSYFPHYSGRLMWWALPGR